MDLGLAASAAGASGSLEIAHARARACGRPVLLSVARPLAGAVDPLQLIAAARAQGEATALFGRGSDRVAIAAFGTAWAAEADGAARFARVADVTQALFADAVVEGGLPPVAIGAFAFSPAPPGGDWTGFPAARVAVPRATIVRRDGEAALVVNALVEPDGHPQATARRLAHASGQVREWSTAPAAEESGRRYSAAAEPDARDWKRAVSAAVADIGAGRFDKLVLARTCRVTASRAMDCARAVARLGQSYPSCTSFWIGAAAGDFLGATPELLVRVHGRAVETTAVAGSSARGTTVDADDELARALLASDKERREHAVVVDALARALRLFCSELTCGPAPAILRLPNVQHLVTPIRGTLRSAPHILEVVAELHPTPAVAGHPRAAALAALAEHEDLERGWYAGPVGWFDASGDGEFAVAIRSALVRDREALLFAGSGIVAGSDAEAELAETRLKLQPLLAALMEL
ncbi:MAG: isochorismate synthase MenF [Candidatus Binatia bacterium]